jgi:glycogen debranching enzyme
VFALKDLLPILPTQVELLLQASWILTSSLIRQQRNHSHKGSSGETLASKHSSSYISTLLSKIGITQPSKVVGFVVPRMLTAVEYLQKRDIDNDSLLEQGSNEDWMDTALRTGKIVYSQACWILALNDLSILLTKTEKESDAKRISELVERATRGVERTLWSEENNCYLDMEQTHYYNKERILTEDVSLYLVAIADNTYRNSLR